jgi:hypothetical protein
MSSVLTSNLQTGGAQFQNALANSQNAINALLRQAGVTGDTSGYSAAGAVGGGGAPTLGTLSYGPEGAFSEAYQAGGNIAAEQAIASRVVVVLVLVGLRLSVKSWRLCRRGRVLGMLLVLLLRVLVLSMVLLNRLMWMSGFGLLMLLRRLRMWLLLLVVLQILMLLVVSLLLVLPQNPELSLTN